MSVGVKRLGIALALLLGSALFLILAGYRPGDPALFPPAAGAPSVAVQIADYGYHAGLFLPSGIVRERAAALGLTPLAGVARDFGAYPLIEFGWGDEGFYRHVPTAGDVTAGLALRALFGMNPFSVVHVVGLMQAPETVLPAGSVKTVHLSQAGFDRLLVALDGSFARAENGAAQRLGPGLYGPSLFYRSGKPYHLFAVCNHWLAGLLNRAGLAINLTLATLPAGLMRQLPNN